MLARIVRAETQPIVNKLNNIEQLLLSRTSLPHDSPVKDLKAAQSWEELMSIEDSLSDPVYLESQAQALKSVGGAEAGSVFRELTRRVAVPSKIKSQVTWAGAKPKKGTHGTFKHAWNQLSGIKKLFFKVLDAKNLSYDDDIYQTAVSNVLRNASSTLSLDDTENE